MTARSANSPIVGRDVELARLRDTLKLIADEPRVMLVGGEAGVGKTRLVAEFTAAAMRDHVQVLCGQCLQLGEEGLPFAPFAGALRELLRRDGPGVFAGHEHDFARLLPELGPVGPSMYAETNPAYLFDLVATLLARLAERCPLLLVVEDLHWADRSTRDLLAYLVRAARPASVLVVATYRSDELHRGHPLRPFLAELDRVRGVERLDLDRLDRDGTAAIMGQLLGGEPSVAFVDTVFERAQGNPFFVEELASCGRTGDLPDSLRDLLLTRVDRLDEAGQRVLRIFAAGGNRIGHELLAEVAGMPHGVLEGALRSAVAEQLIIADADGGYEFRHALVREAVHDDSLPSEKVRLHARYAAAIEADPALVGAGRAPAEIAHHWYLAHEHARALTAAVAAAEAAGGRYAYAEKAGLLERALELWEQVPDAAGLLGMSHLDLLEAIIGAGAAAGDYARTLTLTRVALAEADETADPLRAARLLVRRGKFKRTLGKADGAAELTRAYDLARAGERACPDAAGRRERAVLLADIAAAMVPVDEDTAIGIAEEARAAAQEDGDARIAVSVALTIARVCQPGPSTVDRLEAVRQAAAHAERIGDSDGLVRSMVNISHELFTLGRYAESLAAGEAGLVESRRVNSPRTRGVWLMTNSGEALVALGRWDEAESMCALATRLDLPGVLAVPVLDLRARIRLARGHPAAGEVVTRALSFLHRPFLETQLRVPLQELQLRAHLAAGDVPGALAAATAGLADPGLTLIPRYGWPLLAAAARAAGMGRAADPVGAARIAALVGDIVADVPAMYPAERAAAAEIAAWSANDLAAWHAAVEACRADGQPHPLAESLVRLAEAAGTTGDRPLAAASLAEAVELATPLGATPLLDATTLLGRRLGLRLPGTLTNPADGDVLTAREREVLRLVAEGHSNSRIAAALFISPKTASVHVSRIIAKLAVSNRGEAAAVGRRLGLLD